MLVVVQIERESIVAASLSKSNRALFVCLFTLRNPFHNAYRRAWLVANGFQLQESNISSPSYVAALLSFLSSAVL